MCSPIDADEFIHYIYSLYLFICIHMNIYSLYLVVFGNPTDHLQRHSSFSIEPYQISYVLTLCS